MVRGSLASGISVVVQSIESWNERQPRVFPTIFMLFLNECMLIRISILRGRAYMSINFSMKKHGKNNPHN